MVEDPETLLFFCVDEKKVKVVAINPEVERAKITAQLINEVFNSTSTRLREQAAQVRFDELQEEMNTLFKNLHKMKSSDRKEVLKAQKVLPGLLKRESRFAAFKRNYVREHISDYEELVELVKVS